MRWWCQIFGVVHSLPLVVGEGDSLGGHFEVDYGRGRWRVGAQSHGGGFLHRLDAGEWLHLHRAQVPHVTGCRRTQIWQYYTLIAQLPGAKSPQSKCTRWLSQQAIITGLGSIARASLDALISRCDTEMSVFFAKVSSSLCHHVYLKRALARQLITCPLFEQLGGRVGDWLRGRLLHIFKGIWEYEETAKQKTSEIFFSLRQTQRDLIKRNYRLTVM